MCVGRQERKGKDGKKKTSIFNRNIERNDQKLRDCFLCMRDTFTVQSLDVALELSPLLANTVGQLLAGNTKFSFVALLKVLVERVEE